MTKPTLCSNLLDAKTCFEDYYPTDNPNHFLYHVNDPDDLALHVVAWDLWQKGGGMIFEERMWLPKSYSGRICYLAHRIAYETAVYPDAKLVGNTPV